MAGREESCEESYRVTIINAKTEDQRALEAIIEEAIRSRAISADMIVSIFEKNPAAKEETPFI